jgi:hypothetical protein
MTGAFVVRSVGLCGVLTYASAPPFLSPRLRSFCDALRLVLEKKKNKKKKDEEN